MQNRLSVVMLNWLRPDNARRLTSLYAAMPEVGEVVVFNNNPTVPFTTQDRRIHIYNTNFNPGLPARFAAAGLARNDWVLIVDDDIELPVTTVAGLKKKYELGEYGMVGLFGRRPGSDGSYNTTNVFGPVPILITRAVLTTRTICGSALEHSVNMAGALGGQPFGNGEDIVLSYTALVRTKRPNGAFPLPYRNCGYDDVHAISGKPGHEAHRTKVVEWCERHLRGQVYP
jgi:hypothetical protein